jgi:hypothetical protein
MHHRINIKAVDDQALGRGTNAEHAARSNGKLLFTIHLDLELAADHGADARLAAVRWQLERGAGGEGVYRDGDIFREADGLADGDVRGKV